VKAEGLIYFLRIQPAMANQLTRQEQDGDFVAVTCPRGWFKIDIDDINGCAARRAHAGKLAQHFLAQTAPRP